MNIPPDATPIILSDYMRQTKDGQFFCCPNCLKEHPKPAPAEVGHCDLCGFRWARELGALRVWGIGKFES